MRAALVRPLVPLEAEPVQDLQDLFDRALDEAGLIGVLDAEDEGAVAALAPGLAVAKSQLKRTVRPPPTWSEPVGLGAKRTRTDVLAFMRVLLRCVFTDGQSRSPGAHREEV